MTPRSSAHQLRCALTEARPLHSFVVEQIDPVGRKIPLSRAAHTRGWHPVRQGHGAIPFESGLERKVIDALARHGALFSIRSQPLTVSYRETGEARRYTPDFLVCLSDVPHELARFGFQEQTYIEVKPYEIAIELLPRIALRLAVIEAATGLPAVLITELDVPAIMPGGGRE